MRGYIEPVPRIVGTISTWSPGHRTLAGLASGAWFTANSGVYWPIVVPTTCVARRMWWTNGDTVSASYNLEAGIYTSTAAGGPAGRLVTTGAVAQGTALQVQFADITDTVLAPGLYWMWLSCSSTSATIFRVAPPNLGWDELLHYSQASVGPGSAPATATPTEPSSNADIYLFGFATTASP